MVFFFFLLFVAVFTREKSEKHKSFEFESSRARARTKCENAKGKEITSFTCAVGTVDALPDARDGGGPSPPSPPFCQRFGRRRRQLTLAHNECGTISGAAF